MVRRKDFKPIIRSAEYFPGIKPRSFQQGKPFIMITHDFILKFARHFSPSVVTVYMALCLHVDNVEQTCFVSLERLMEEAGIGSRNTVLEALKKLEDYQIISVIHAKGGRTANFYLLTDATVWKPVCSSVNGTTRSPIGVPEIEFSKFSEPTPWSSEIGTRTKVTKEVTKYEINNEEIKGKNFEHQMYDLFGDYFLHEDILKAVTEVSESSEGIASMVVVQKLLQKWCTMGIVTSINGVFPKWWLK